MPVPRYQTVELVTGKMELKVLSKLAVWVFHSVQRRLVIAMVVVITILMGLFTYYIVQNLREVTENAMLEKGRMMALNGSLSIQYILEQAIDNGSLTKAQVFDTNYTPISGIGQLKYHTAYDNFSDANFQKIEDGFLSDSDIIFAVAEDVNGYIPTHNLTYSRPLTGNNSVDTIYNRTKRIFNDVTGLAAAKNTTPYLRQVYHRDTGETLWDISVPIMVKGEHWGAFRIGFSLDRINQHLFVISERITLAAVVTIMNVVLAAYLLSYSLHGITGLSRVADQIAQGKTVEKIPVKSQDELGVLASSFNRIVDYQRNIASAAERITHGDLNVEISPISPEDNLGVSFAKMVANIRQYTTELEDERNLLQVLMDNSADLIYFKDLGSRFTRVSKSFVRRYNITSGNELIGKTDFDVFAPAHAIPAFEDEQNIINTGAPMVNKEEEEIWGDGRSGWVSTTKMPIFDKAGKVVGTFGISRDITEKKIVYNELQASQNQMMLEINRRISIEKLLNAEKETLNTTLLSINEGVIATDENGAITFINRSALEITGFEALESLNQPLAHVFRILEEETNMDTSALIKALYLMDKVQKEKPNYKTPILLTKKNEKKSVSGSISSIQSSNKKLFGHVIVFQDVTPKQRMEAQSALSQKMEAIGQLATGIAHEINTPIQYVGDNLRYLNRSFTKIIETVGLYQQSMKEHVNKTYSQDELNLLENQMDTRKIQRYVTEVPSAIEESMSGIERVRKIVLAIREFSHPSQKEKRLSDVNHGIETTATISRNEWKYVADLGLNLDLNLPLVNCQIDEINQVILNMIINSAQAIQDITSQNLDQKGKITISTQKKGDFVVITIQDTGCGIPESIQQRIFDPFFTTKGIGKGTGQGLYLAHNIIVNKHGGQISCESKPGNGTTFTIEIPLNAQE